MNEPLTLEIIKSAIDTLDKNRIEVLEINPHPILKGKQTVIKQGNKIYYSPDIKSGEVKVITFPEFEFIIDADKFEITYDQSH